eukprot:scaffold4250_cov247-Pinguiococcus_pyrenoidosus.AAC.2
MQDDHPIMQEIGRSAYGRLLYRGESLLGLPHGHQGDLLLELQGRKGAKGPILPLYSGGWDCGLWSGHGQEWIYTFSADKAPYVDYELLETFEGRFQLGRRDGCGTLWRPQQQMQLEGSFTGGHVRGLGCIR